ncbi:MAG: hypothetical protein A3E25_17885 [Burkholderiales bacterium RIFCSPHIGHO2_12_FULL_69_20]|nr:MAG: hypothetical protein A3E25_17885 [Burkholderiales bacterium RIFCSPHIGHO2_12_FULL_69_20]
MEARSTQGNLSEWLSGLVAVAVATLVLWPWVTGLVDVAMWTVTGRQLSSIPWDAGRGVLLIAWPILGLLVAAMLTGLFLT